MSGDSEARARGRECFGRRAWADAFAELSAADRSAPLEPEDVERLAMAAYLIGRDQASVAAWERAHHAQLERGEVERAARCAGWLVFVLLNGGELARAGGWLARARRLVDEVGHDCAEQGHLLVPVAFQRAFEGDWPDAYAIAGRAVEIGLRFGDVDLVTLARNIQGRALIAQGDTTAGMTLLDEVMVAVMADEVSEIVAGLGLLQRDRGLPGGLRSAPGAGVDGGTDPLVRLAAGPGPVQRPLPGPSRRDHAAARRVAGRARRGAACV